jgi:hypothetical protein
LLHLRLLEPDDELDDELGRGTAMKNTAETATTVLRCATEIVDPAGITSSCDPSNRSTSSGCGSVSVGRLDSTGSVVGTRVVVAIGSVVVVGTLVAATGSRPTAVTVGRASVVVVSHTGDSVVEGTGTASVVVLISVVATTGSVVVGGSETLTGGNAVVVEGTAGSPVEKAEAGTTVQS